MDAILIKNMPIPINTDIIELILCFTTSVSLEAFLFGYFKLIISPIVADNNIIIKLITNINIIYNKLGLNFIKNISSDIKMNGNSMINGYIILDFNISFSDTGRLFVILIVFPSSEIHDDVIEVIDKENSTKT